MSEYEINTLTIKNIIVIGYFFFITALLLRHDRVGYPQSEGPARDRGFTSGPITVHLLLILVILCPGVGA